MKRCVLNVAVGSWYPQGQARLHNSLLIHKFDGDFLSWTNWPEGCPSQSESPYAFKSYAFAKAQAEGYDTALWLDASCWAIQPLEPLFEHIEEAGHCFSYEGWWAGQWLKDEALVTLGVTRDEALKIPLLGGCFMGISLRHPRSQTWLAEFTRVCQDGTTLAPLARNVNGSVSSDPRCLGHIADQAVASVIAHKLGMELTHPPKWRDWHKHPADPSTVVHAQGM